MINRRRRNPILANIWWLLAIVIIAGVLTNYFFIKKDLPFEAPVHKDQDNALAQGPLLPIQSWQTSQGLNAYFLPIDNLPIVDVQLIFAAGSAYDANTPGIAQITNQLIGKNTWDLSTDAIAENFESVGALFSTHITRDSASVNLRTLSFKDERSKAIELFTHIFKDAYFAEDSFSLEKEQLLTAIAAQTQSPQAQASKAFYQAIYGEHPYASPITGYANSVNNLMLNDAMNFYKARYTLNNAVIIITGHLTREEAEEISESLAGALVLEGSTTDIPVVNLPAASIFEHVAFPSTQKHILVGLPTLEKGNPDFFAFYVGNEILGGSGLSSQLFDIVREQEGLAYSVSSQIMPLKQKGPFIISLQTRNDSSDIALALVQDHLKSFIDNGPTEEELTKAKQNIAGSFLMAFNSNAAIAQNIATLAFYRLPLDYFDHYIDKINAVTLDDIKRVFNEYIGSEKINTVTLGVDETKAASENAQ